MKKSFYDQKLKQAEAYAAKQKEIERIRLVAIKEAKEEKEINDAKAHAELARKRLAAKEAGKIREAKRLQAKNLKADFTKEDIQQRIDLIEYFDDSLLCDNEIKRCSGCHFPQFITSRNCNFCGYSLFESKCFSKLTQSEKNIFAQESLKAISNQKLYENDLLDILTSKSSTKIEG